MKNSKFITAVLIISVLGALPVFGQETRKSYKLKTFTFTLKGDYMSVTDPDYEDLYGEKKYFPEAEIEIRFVRNVYLWGSYSLISSKGEWFEWSNKSLVDPDFLWSVSVKRHQYAFGIGYFIGLHDPGEFVVRVQLGACLIDQNENTEKIFIPSDEIYESTKTSLNRIGAIGELGIDYVLWRNIFAEFSIGYVYATKKVEDEEGDTVSEEIGGLKIGLGLGIRF